MGIHFNWGGCIQDNNWLLGWVMRFNTPLKGGGRPTSGSYCANNPPYVSHQKITCIMDRYELPDNKNISIFNKMKEWSTNDAMVSDSRGIMVVGSVHASTSIIMGSSKSATIMIHEYAHTSVWLNSLVMISMIILASVWICLLLWLKWYPLWIIIKILFICLFRVGKPSK